mgnify:CR=1 FL=1
MSNLEKAKPDLRVLSLGADYLNNSGTDASYIQFTTDGTEKARISADGKLGIGTDNPQKTLDSLNKFNAPKFIRNQVISELLK